MISMSFAGSSGSFHSEIDHSKIAQVRRMNHNMSGSSLMLNVPGAGSSRASLNLPRPSTSTTHFHTNISDVAPPRASFSGYDSNFSAIAMARRQEQLSRSSLNETLKDAPPIPTVPARRQHVPSHASNASGSSHQTTHSSRTSFQQRPSPLSTSGECTYSRYALSCANVRQTRHQLRVPIAHLARRTLQAAPPVCTRLSVVRVSPWC